LPANRSHRRWRLDKHRSITRARKNSFTLGSQRVGEISLESSRRLARLHRVHDPEVAHLRAVAAGSALDTQDARRP
jgi:hypothetical protein